MSVRHKLGDNYMQRPCLSFLLALILITSTSCDIPTKDNQLFTEEEISYFLEIAFSAEYGNEVEKIKKWTSDIRIEILGSPTPEDKKELNKVVSELNNLIDRFTW